MRVLAIGNRDPFADGGGYERIFAGTVELLRERGHEVRVLTPPELDWFWRDGQWIKRVKRRRNRRTLASALDGVDVVSYWGMGGMDLTLIDQVRCAGVPAVGVVGDGWMVYGPSVDRSGVVLGTGVLWLFIAEAVRKRAIEEGHVLPCTDLAHPGVEPAAFPRAPEVPWRWRLGCVGRVDAKKGIEVAIAALAQLPEASLVINGPDDGYGASLAADERVHWTCTAAADVASAYGSLDCLLFPVTWEEPWGLVPIEAMSVGRPVIATGTGGSAEYLRHEENCLLVPVGDADALATAVRRLAEDPALRTRLREGGFVTAARFPAAAFYENVVAALDNAS